MTHHFHHLQVWQKAKNLSVGIYRITRRFPIVERFGMVSQMQRASVSIASNIAEGAGRKSRGDFVNFLYYALGSAFELETQLIICFEVGLITQEEHKSLIATIHDIQPMIHSLINRMRLEDGQQGRGS